MLVDGYTEKMSSMLDEIASKTVHKYKEGGSHSTKFKQGLKYL